MLQGYPERGSFPPIAEYAFLSDCEVAALVAPSGNVEWLCLPQFDSPSVFAPILDRDAGRFRLGPADVQVPATRRYLPGSMVLETSWKTRTGWLVVRDALTIGPWHHSSERAHRQRRAPGDWEAEHVLLRTVRCPQGTVELHLECEPYFEYGRLPAGWTYVGPTYHDARASAEGASIEIGLTTSLRLGFEGTRAAARTTLREGETAFVALHWSEHGGPQSAEDAYARMNRTSAYWREWLSHGEFPDHPWRSYLERSAITLKGLSYAPTGASISAPTTSLPRVPGGERNYDYRYTFKRDAGFTLWAGYSLGFDWEADDFFYFLADVSDERRATQNMFAVNGDGDLSERTLENLSGYSGAQPVRIGNDAYEYEQHDVYGAIVDAADMHAGTRDQLPERVWPAIRRQVELAAEHWREPDRGIWATRGDPRHYTSSKVMCWTALDRGARLAGRRQDLDLQDQWRLCAAEIQQDVIDNALDDRGVFTAHYDTDELDASVLLMALVRFLPPSDHRIRQTVLAIADELGSGGIVLRHQPEDPDDSVEGEAYAVCSFWLVSALAEIGEVTRARELCERMLAAASPLQLYAEHLDPRTGRHLGNFPHAFTHLALINAIAHVIAADSRAGGPS